MTDERDKIRTAEAREALRRLGQDGDQLGRSALADAAKRAQAHFSADDAAPGDNIERWGMIIARVAAGLAALWLIYSLVYDR